LGYGDKEFVVSNDVGILYDYDETDNLPKKLSELGKISLLTETLYFS
jgi:ubiquitin-like 1-activating enzyme E1 B